MNKINNNDKYTQYILFSIALIDFMGFTISATVFPDLLLDKHQGILSDLFSYDQRKPESVLKISMLLPGIGTLGIMLSTTWLALHISVFLFSCSMGFTLSSLLATISNKGKIDEQGLLLGMAQSTQALVTMLVTFLGGQLLAINNLSSEFYLYKLLNIFSLPCHCERSEAI